MTVSEFLEKHTNIKWYISKALAVLGVAFSSLPTPTSGGMIPFAFWKAKASANNVWEVYGSVPATRRYHTAVWTGSKMIIWGGYNGSYANTGGQYDPTADSWTATTTTGAPDGRVDGNPIWTGTKMIIWGGIDLSPMNTGGLYNPTADSWTTTSTTGVPTARYNHSTVWTGTKMLVFGGYNFNGSTYFNDLGVYTP